VLRGGGLDEARSTLLGLPGGPQEANYKARVRLGLQRFGLHVNLGIPPQDQGATPYSSLLDTDPLSLDIDDTTLWVAGITLEFGLADGLGASVSALGSIPRDVVVRSEVSPAVGSAALGVPVGISHWRGSELEWWQIDLSIAYRFWGNAGVIAGIRWDRTSAALSDPFPPPSTTIIPISNALVNNIDSLTGHLRTTFTAFYVGILWAPSNYNYSFAIFHEMGRGPSANHLE